MVSVARGRICVAAAERDQPVARLHHLPDVGAGVGDVGQGVSLAGPEEVGGVPTGLDARLRGHFASSKGK